MNVLDLIILICFIPAIVRGVSKGFVEQLSAVLAVVVGIVTATKLSGTVAEWMGSFLQTDTRIIGVVAFLSVALGAILIVSICARLVSKIIRIAMLGWLDKLLGLILSIGVMTMIIGVFILLIDSINATLGFIKPETIDNSILYNLIRNICNAVFPSIKDLIGNA